MTAPDPPQLDYAQRSLVSRMAPRRLVVYAIALATALTIALAYEPAVRRVDRWRARRAFLAREAPCLTYAAPADRVVYEEDPARAAALAARDPAYVLVTAFDLPTSSPLQLPGQMPVQYAERLWAEYHDGTAVAGRSPPRTVAFLHERLSKSGRRGLVAVEVSAQVHQVSAGRWGMFRALVANRFEPGAMAYTGPTPTQEVLHIDVDAVRPPGPPPRDRPEPFHIPAPLRLYAGQPDPNDTSRFTIAYELQGVRGEIVGVLEDNGAVRLTPDVDRYERSGSAIGYATWVPAIDETRSPTR
jgi:hypothetical protein